MFKLASYEKKNEQEEGNRHAVLTGALWWSFKVTLALYSTRDTHPFPLLATLSNTACAKSEALYHEVDDQFTKVLIAW